MSLPTAKFSELSLGKMPTTRAQSSRLSQSGKDMAENDSSDSEDEAPEPQSMLSYDQRDLTPTTKERLVASFEGRFSVEYCGQRSTDKDSHRGTYYAFQLAEVVARSIRMGDPSSNYSNIECYKCSEPQPCRHVFWLLDQINKHTLTAAQKRGSLTLSNRGYPTEVPGPFERVSSMGIAELAEKAHWEIRPELYVKPDQEAKVEEIREIMAALSPRMIDDYRPDIFDNLIEDVTFETALAQRDLAALVAKSLLLNADMFHHFRALVSPNQCAIDLFQRMKDRADDAFARTSTYLRTGAADPATRDVCDIPWCARTLIAIVGTIRPKILTAPLARNAKAEAATTLVHLLQEVVHRNHDAYAASARWDHTPQRRMPEKDKNLFHRLIVSPTRSADPPFIIYELNFLSDAARHLVDPMEWIAEQMPKGGAPSAYTAKFRELLARMKRGEGGGGGGGGSGSGGGAPGSAGASRPASGASGSGAPKRSGAEMQRDPKRMK